MTDAPAPPRASKTTEHFVRDGFAVVGPLAGRRTLDMLRRAYLQILNREIDVPGDRQLGDITRQVMHPHLSHELFKKNEAVEAARSIAADLVECEHPRFFYSMLIYKPPHHPHTTPWHQDMAYAERPFTRAGVPSASRAIVQFWMALEDVDKTMGCMEFRPGVHREPLLPHYVASGDPNEDHRLIAIEDSALEGLPEPVACPLPAGWATVHDYNTPHYTGPNRSDRARPAYIFSFQNPDRVKEMESLFTFHDNRPAD